MATMHRAFLVLSAGMSLLCLLGSFLLNGKHCDMGFLLWYCLYWMGQAIQHFLSSIISRIDAVKYSLFIRRFLGAILVVDLMYFFLVVTFWMQSAVHPFYCFLCNQLGLSRAVGVLLLLHFFVALCFFIQLLYAYIKRKYYLISLGGFAL